MNYSDPRPSYTLLADDTRPFASDPSSINGLRAHIVLTLLLYSSLTFSDNQIVNGLNLRTLLRNDQNLRLLLESGQISFAIRQDKHSQQNTDVQPLKAIQDAFKNEGKLRVPDEFIADAPELELIERHGKIIPWRYKQVRDGYTERVLKLLYSNQSQELLGNDAFRILHSLVEQELERSRANDPGLGREFVRYRLPNQLYKGPLSEEHFHKVDSYLKRCADAPYLSNLPDILGRSPLYEADQQEAFALLKNRSNEFEELLPSQKVGPPLKTAQFIEGLNRLGFEDLMNLRSGREFKEFQKISVAGVNNERECIELQLAFEQLVTRIEDKIITKFPELKTFDEANTRHVRTKISTVREGLGQFENFISLVTSVPLFNVSSLLFNFGAKKLGLDNQTLSVKEIAERKVQQARLEQTLDAEGKKGLLRSTSLQDRVQSETIVETE